MSLDSKGRIILSLKESETVVLFLSRLRHTDFNDEEHVLDNWTDTRQILIALTEAGFAVLPQGSIDSIVKELTRCIGVGNAPSDSFDEYLKRMQGQ